MQVSSLHRGKSSSDLKGTVLFVDSDSPIGQSSHDTEQDSPDSANSSVPEVEPILKDVIGQAIRALPANARVKFQEFGRMVSQASKPIRVAIDTLKAYCGSWDPWALGLDVYIF